MTFFTHEVGGEVYGAWYRQLSSLELEIIGAGFLRRVSYAGVDELSVARSVLENYVQAQKKIGGPVLPLGSSAAAPAASST